MPVTCNVHGTFRGKVPELDGSHQHALPPVPPPGPTRPSVGWALCRETYVFFTFLGFDFYVFAFTFLVFYYFCIVFVLDWKKYFQKIERPQLQFCFVQNKSSRWNLSVSGMRKWGVTRSIEMRPGSYLLRPIWFVRIVLVSSPSNTFSTYHRDKSNIYCTGYLCNGVNGVERKAAESS